MIRLVEGIEGPAPLDGGLDRGEGRDERERARRGCPYHTWCIEPLGHAGTCTLIEGRTLYEPTTRGR